MPFRKFLVFSTVTSVPVAILSHYLGHFGIP
jgi:hypothetical protein